MLRLPPFRYARPRTVMEAVAVKRDFGAEATFVAGGTDVLPSMKRGQQNPSVLIQLRGLTELQRIDRDPSHLRIGAGVTLAAAASNNDILRDAPALAAAARGVATPLIRNLATIGGNLCLDTRCNYYDQSEQWRRGIGFCLKRDGETCWVAPSSPRCWAVQSSDTAPAAIALGAQVELTGPNGIRSVPASEFYRDDGIEYLTKQADELVSALRIPRVEGARSSYLKVSRRASFDFPVLGVAAWIRRNGPSAPVADVRLVLGAIGSAPIVIDDAPALLVGRPWNEDAIVALAEAAWKQARPLDNTDQGRSWRKAVVRTHVVRALRGLLDPSS